MTDLVPIRRALLSVSDKTGLVPFATALVKEFNVELISTGGTAKALRDAGLTVKDVSEVTGFPEMMDGRVKTLHPAIHGGLLALRDDAEHVAAMKKHGITPIDLVVVNLYPFAQTVAKPGVTFDEAIENIDIGGPSMIRSAAKNHRSVLVVTSPDRYEKVLGDLREHKGSSCAKHRLKQAQRAFAHTSEYDGAIARYLGDALSTTKKDAGYVGNFSTTFRTALSKLCYQEALAVGGTEAIAFEVSGGNPVVVSHIRPGEPDNNIRVTARHAFRELIEPVLNDGRSFAAVTGEVISGENPQYILVNAHQHKSSVAAVTAVIVRCSSAADANAALARMQETSRAAWIEATVELEGVLPAALPTAMVRQQTLRYGENPHQKAALYVPENASTDRPSLATAKQLHGKELSYINLLDADGALACVRDFAGPAACIVKHATPCGVATATDLATAFANAYDADALAAFGGIVAVNRPIDLATAQRVVEGQKFLEVIVAPGYADDALALLKDRWKNVRLLSLGSMTVPVASGKNERDVRASLSIRSIDGGFLVQESDSVGIVESEWKVASTRQPTAAELADMRFAWLACKHVKSNAIVLAKNGATVGIGGGQVDRVGAARIAIEKAGAKAAGSAVASDAFFPFPDGPELLLKAGITAIVQPGGSQRDQLTIDAVNAAGAAMIFTGRRHFRH